MPIRRCPKPSRRRRWRWTSARSICETMRRLLRPLWIPLALVFLFEAWLWEHLRPIVAWVVARIRWDRLKARVATAIEDLPPAATFVVFLVPVAALFPLKLVGLWMLARGSWLGAMAT